MLKSEKITSYLNNFIEANILLVLFCLPFSKSAVELCVTLAITAFLAKKIFIEKSLGLKIDKKILIGLSLFIIFNLVSMINSQYFADSLRAFFSKALKWAAFFIITADTVRTPRQARRIFITMVFSCALILFDAIYQQYVTGRDFLHYPNRYPVFKFHARKSGGMSFPTASFPYPNDFASWINVCLFTFTAMAVFNLKNNIIYRSAAACLSAFLAFFLFLTTSSSALLGAFLSTCLLVIMNIKKLIFPVAVVLIAVILAVSFVPYLKAYLTQGTLSKALSINDRKAMWSAGWRIFMQHPVLGNGINTFFEHFKYFREDEDKYKHGSYAHNCYLQMAADTGLVGLLAFLYFVLTTIFLNLRKAAKKAATFEGSLALGLALGVITFLVHAAFDTNLYSLNLAALFWLSMGAMEGLGSSCG
jgi:putative inorganic carbon (hco3(-)) transporter